MSASSILLGLALVHLLAISSPGPTFVVVTRYAAAGDRRAGLLVALGVCCATLAWAAFAATGLGALVSAYPGFYRAIQYAGALYLVWLGVRLVHGFMTARGGAGADLPPEARRPGGWRAVAAGFLTNISNPKVIAYYTSLFGTMIPPQAGTGFFAAVVLTVLAVSAAWWCAVALLFSSGAVHRGFLRIRRWLDLTMGVLLIAIGMKLALGW